MEMSLNLTLIIAIKLLKSLVFVDILYIVSYWANGLNTAFLERVR